MRTEYKNLNGESGIVAYEVFSETIEIEFSNGKVYTYTKANLGETDFAIMAALADAGAGLNAFLNRVRNRARRTPNPTLPSVLRDSVKVNLPTAEAVAVVTELLKNFNVTISVS